MPAVSLRNASHPRSADRRCRPGPLRDCSDATSLLELDLPEDAFAEYFLEFLEARLPEPRSIGPFSRASLVSVDGLLVALKLGDRYFGVADDGRIVNHAETIGSWESFLPVSRRTIDALRDVLASDWLVEETRTLVPAAAIDLAPGMTLVVGSERFRLDELSTLAIEPGCGTLTFLAGGGACVGCSGGIRWSPSRPIGRRTSWNR